MKGANFNSATSSSLKTSKAAVSKNFTSSATSLQISKNSNLNTISSFEELDNEAYFYDVEKMSEDCDKVKFSVQVNIKRIKFFVL